MTTLTSPATQRRTLNDRDAAKYLGISTRSLWSLTSPRGPIPCCRIGGRVIYTQDALDAYLDSLLAESAAAVAAK